jgi:hypothetical protein
MQDLDRDDMLFHEHMQALRVRLGGALSAAGVAVVFLVLFGWAA